MPGITVLSPNSISNPCQYFFHPTAFSFSSVSFVFFWISVCIFPFPLCYFFRRFSFNIYLLVCWQSCQKVRLGRGWLLFRRDQVSLPAISARQYQRHWLRKFSPFRVAGHFTKFHQIIFFYLCIYCRLHQFVSVLYFIPLVCLNFVKYDSFEFGVSSFHTSSV